MAVIAEPAFAVGAGFTTISLLALTDEQGDIPVVVNVKVVVPL